MAGSAASAGTINYGIDNPYATRSMFSRAAWTLGFAVLIYSINAAEYPGPAARLAGVLALAALVFIGTGWWMLKSSREGKLAVRDQMLDLAALDGSEKVLDVGCGLGLLTIGAAQRLKTGKAIGIGTWDPAQLSGNTADAARENAKAAGVAEKLRFENGDMPKLTYPDGQFDVVTSFLAVHHLPEENDREQALREMLRVLKPGGRLVIHDIHYAADYAQTLRAAGAQDVSLSATSYLWAKPGATISARK